MFSKEINELENEIKGLFEKDQKKLIFKAKNYASIMKITLDLIEKFNKKHKEFKTLTADEQSDVIANVVLFISIKAKTFDIITEEQFEHITTFIEYKDVIQDFVEMYVTPKCLKKWFRCC